VAWLSASAQRWLVVCSAPVSSLVCDATFFSFLHSQNNNRGGYNVGSVYYCQCLLSQLLCCPLHSVCCCLTLLLPCCALCFCADTGSTVTFEWTAQHSCGDKTRANCEIIIQYACDDRLRDGTVTTTIPTNPNQCYNWDCGQCTNRTRRPQRTSAPTQPPMAARPQRRSCHERNVRREG
jgi:hypothetical protein